MVLSLFSSLLFFSSHSLSSRASRISHWPPVPPPQKLVELAVIEEQLIPVLWLASTWRRDWHEVLPCRCHGGCAELMLCLYLLLSHPPTSPPSSPALPIIYSLFLFYPLSLSSFRECVCVWKHLIVLFLSSFLTKKKKGVFLLFFLLLFALPLPYTPPSLISPRREWYCVSLAYLPSGEGPISQFLQLSSCSFFDLFIYLLGRHVNLHRQSASLFLQHSDLTSASLTRRCACMSVAVCVGAHPSVPLETCLS